MPLADIVYSSSSKVSVTIHASCIAIFHSDEGAMNVHSPLLNLRLNVHKVFFSNGDPFSHLIGVKCTDMKIRK